MKHSKLWIVIAGICIVIGAVLVGSGFALGGALHSAFGLHFDDHSFSLGFSRDRDYDKSTPYSTNDTVTIPLEEFHEVTMDITLGDIEIRRGKRLELQVKMHRRTTIQ